MQHNVPKSKLELIGENDRLFQKSGYPKPFSFNHDVAQVFDDMVTRSVPIYVEVHHHMSQWLKRMCQNDDIIVDLGCSTGTTILYLGQCLSERLRFIGIDNSEAMISKAESKLARLPERHRIELRCEDITQADFSNAGFVVMNYTLQFLPVAKRAQLIEHIYRGMRPGGILFLSEKLRAEHPILEETSTSIYENFKLEQGYTHSEIARKKEALENVLVPYTETQCRKLLEKSGFAAIDTIVKWNNFASFIAVKAPT